MFRLLLAKMMSGTDQSVEMEKHLDNSNLVTDILQEYTSDDKIEETSYYNKITVFSLCQLLNIIWCKKSRRRPGNGN